MPRRKSTTEDQIDGLRDASDSKTRARLRKLMASLGVPSNAAEVRFTMGDKPTVVWLMERP